MPVNSTNELRSQMTDRTGAITILDVLGWKGIWSRDPAAINALMSLVGVAQYTAAQLCRDGRDRFGVISGIAQDEMVHVSSFSDTILFITDADNPEAELTIHGEFCRELVCTAIGMRLPIRGATGYGKYWRSPDWNILMGPVVDEVAEWYEDIGWIGVTMTPSAKFNWSDFGDDPWIDYGPLHSRNHGIVEARCVNWADRWHKDHSTAAVAEENLQQAFRQTNCPTCERVASIYSNTIEYYMEICQRSCHS